ncbi:MAG: endonuclease Q family protein [Promethearchaeota archaeon]
MQRVCDLHIHSKYSGGTSNNINLLEIAKNCKIKGINIVGTGDCLYPLWLRELRNNLVEYNSGIYYLHQIPEVNFILQTEVEIIWVVKSQMKKAHFIILLPNFERLEEISEFLSLYGRLNFNGRPKLNISAENFVLGLKSIDSSIEIIPAHIFTPYFGILGNKLKFKSIIEGLGQATAYIHAIETGLSADPSMIRMVSELNRFTIISNSDAHSTQFHRLGREATVLSINKLTYQNIIATIKSNKIDKTYEFKPSEGKYYYDGHRSERHSNGIDYYCSPKRKKKKCPYCGKALTKGVLSRVYELSDQEPNLNLNYQYIVPLLHLISVVLGGTEYSYKNLSLYQKLVKNNDGEYKIWNGSKNFEGIPEKLITAIYKIQKGNYYFLPGHDGIYGKLQLEV